MVPIFIGRTCLPDSIVIYNGLERAKMLKTKTYYSLLDQPLISTFKVNENKVPLSFGFGITRGRYDISVILYL